eukprot:gene2557-24146_t
MFGAEIGTGGARRIVGIAAMWLRCVLGSAWGAGFVGELECATDLGSAWVDVALSGAMSLCALGSAWGAGCKLELEVELSLCVQCGGASERRVLEKVLELVLGSALGAAWGGGDCDGDVCDFVKFMRLGRALSDQIRGVGYLPSRAHEHPHSYVHFVVYESSGAAWIAMRLGGKLWYLSRRAIQALLHAMFGNQAAAAAPRRNDEQQGEGQNKIVLRFLAPPAVHCRRPDVHVRGRLNMPIKKIAYCFRKNGGPKEMLEQRTRDVYLRTGIHCRISVPVVLKIEGDLASALGVDPQPNNVFLLPGDATPEQMDLKDGDRVAAIVACQAPPQEEPIPRRMNPRGRRVTTVVHIVRDEILAETNPEHPDAFDEYGMERQWKIEILMQEFARRRNVYASEAALEHSTQQAKRMMEQAERSRAGQKEEPPMVQQGKNPRAKE